MKILVDMNLSPKLAEALKTSGHETLHWSEIGAENAPDPEVFTYALQTGAVILTADLDFGTLLASTRSSKPSVILLRLPLTRWDKALYPVLEALAQFKSQLEAGALINIDAASFRARILPFG